MIINTNKIANNELKSVSRDGEENIDWINNELYEKNKKFGGKKN